MGAQAVRKMLLKRAARGKQDKLLVSFGEHASRAAGKKFLPTIFGHGGLFAKEDATGRTHAETKRQINDYERLSREDWGGYLKNFREKLGRNFEYYQELGAARLYLKGKGKVAYPQWFSEKESRKLAHMLNLEERALAASNPTNLAAREAGDKRVRVALALSSFNDYLNSAAEYDRVHNKRIVENLSRIKGNVLARYGTAHSLLFRDLKGRRPDAERAFGGNQTIFSRVSALIRGKTMGKYSVPPKNELAKAYIEQWVFKPAKTFVQDELGFSSNEPRLALFERALTDGLGPEAAKLLEGVPEGSDAKQHIFEQALMLDFKKHGLPFEFWKAKPEMKLQMMKEFCKRVYGENSKLYRIAYRS